MYVLATVWKVCLVFLMETHNLFCYSRACLLSFHSSTKEQKCWVIGDTYRDTIPHLYQENNRNE